MKKLLITLLTCTLLIGGCSSLTQAEENTKEQHEEVANELEVIMGKFNSLIPQNVDTLNQEHMEYTQKIARLVELLAQNSKELKFYAKNQSELFLQYANELESDAQKLRTNLKNQSKREEIHPTLQNIERTCYQCHASLHE